MTLMERRRALMAMAQQGGVQVEKTEFIVETDMVTTATGGNTKHFYDTYKGTERGYYIFDVTGNATSNGYAQAAYHDYRTGKNLFTCIRRTNSYSSIVNNSSYDMFLKAGTKITRYFIPEEAFS